LNGRFQFQLSAFKISDFSSTARDFANEMKNKTIQQELTETTENLLRLLCDLLFKFKNRQS